MSNDDLGTAEQAKTEIGHRRSFSRVHPDTEFISATTQRKLASKIHPAPSKMNNPSHGPGLRWKKSRTAIMYVVVSVIQSTYNMKNKMMEQSRPSSGEKQFLQISLTV